MKSRKHKLFPPICLLLAAALLLSGLSGCGGQEKASESTDGAAAAAADGGTEQNQIVYVPRFVPVDGFGDRASFSDGVWVGDYCYASAYEMVSGPDTEEEKRVYAPVLYCVGLDGKAQRLAWQPERVENPETDFVGASIIGGSEDGGLLVLERTGHSWYEGPEDLTRDDDGYWDYYRNEQHYTIRALDSQGSELSSFSLDELAGHEEGGEGFYPQNSVVDAGGNICFSSGEQITVITQSGETLSALTLTAEGWIDALVPLSDGRVVCAYYGGRGMTLAPFDPVTGAWEEGQSVNCDGNSLIPGSGDYDLYYSSGIYFYGYSLETGEAVKLLNWLDCDVNPESYESIITVRPDGTILLGSSTYDGQHENVENDIVVLEAKPAGEAPQKQTITLATQSLNYDMRAKIIQFNRKSDTCRVVVQDYEEYNDYSSEDEADYTAGLTKLKTEIGAGKLPDILDLYGLPLEQLAAQGLLEDLYPYIDGDEAVNREDMIPNVLEALEVDGKLYTTCGYFDIWTAIGAASVVGDTPGWTYDEFNAALASMPEGCTAFDKFTSRNNILRFCLAMDGDSYVNWATGECSFETDAFYKMLEYVKSFPDEIDWEHYEYDDSDSTPKRVAEGKQMLIETGASDLYGLQMYEAVFGEDITFIGFPTESGSGSMINTESGYAMTSKCADKAAAWSFLREIFLDQDFDDPRNGSGIPINAAAFEKLLEKAMTPEYKKDENGEYVLDENGQRIEESQGGWGWDDISVELYALKPEQAQRIRDVVYSTTKLFKFDESIYDIVSEQLPAFFSGEKSAQEVARLIQSKANIYVTDQRSNSSIQPKGLD